MAIAPELRAQILRLFQAERLRVGSIARQLAVQHCTVRRVLDESGVVNVVHALSTARVTRADPYLPFMLETLTRFPALTASRLHAMVCERGYVGGVDHFCHVVARHRQRPVAEAYLSYSSRYADPLFELISRRHEPKSTLLTKHESFADWNVVFPNAPA